MVMCAASASISGRFALSRIGNTISDNAYSRRFCFRANCSMPSFSSAWLTFTRERSLRSDSFCHSRRALICWSALSLLIPRSVSDFSKLPAGILLRCSRSEIARFISSAVTTTLLFSASCFSSASSIKLSRICGEKRFLVSVLSGILEDEKTSCSLFSSMVLVSALPFTTATIFTSFAQSGAAQSSISALLVCKIFERQLEGERCGWRDVAITRILAV